MKNLLIVGTNFPPSPSIGTQRVIRICKYLCNYQWNIYVLSLKEKYYNKNINDEDKSIRDILEKINITRTNRLEFLSYFFIFKKNSNKNNGKKINNYDKKHCIFIKKIKNILRNKIKEVYDFLFEFPDKEIKWLPIALIYGYFIIKRNNIDIIFSSSPPHTNHLVAVLLKILTRRKLVVDFRDPWARSVWEEQKLTTVKRIRHKFDLLLEKLIIRKADKIIFITHELKKDFMNYYSSLYHKKFYVFLNGYDPDNILKIPSVANKNSKKFIFAHTGTLYKKRNPSQIIYAIKDIIENDSSMRENIIVRFVGTISQELSHVVDIVSQIGLKDVIQFIPHVDYVKSLEYMNESDVLVILQPETHFQIPAKLYDYICFDKPILALGKKGGATENMIMDRFGIFADYNNIDDIKNSIIYLYNNPFYNVEMIRKNREEYNISKSIDLLNNILKF